MTGPEKIGLIYTQNTYSYYGIYLVFRVYYTICEFLRKFCVYQVYDEIYVKILLGKRVIIFGRLKVKFYMHIRLVFLGPVPSTSTVHSVMLLTVVNI